MRKKSKNHNGKVAEWRGIIQQSVKDIRKDIMHINNNINELFAKIDKLLESYVETKTTTEYLKKWHWKIIVGMLMAIGSGFIGIIFNFVKK